MLATNCKDYILNFLYTYTIELLLVDKAKVYSCFSLRIQHNDTLKIAKDYILNSDTYTIKKKLDFKARITHALTLEYNIMLPIN